MMNKQDKCLLTIISNVVFIVAVCLLLLYFVEV